MCFFKERLMRIIERPKLSFHRRIEIRSFSVLRKTAQHIHERPGKIT
jgi:hypothetical protein